jgi:hypothetical protein
MKRWFVIGVLALAGCGDDGSSDPVNRVKREAVRDRMRAEAEMERDLADARAKAAERETAKLKAQVDGLIEVSEQLNAEMMAAQADLAAARSEAERAAVQAKMTEIRARQRVAQERIDKVKAGVKLKCPPDQPLC